MNRVKILNSRDHHETLPVDYIHQYMKIMYYKFLKFAYLIMQIRRNLIKYARFLDIFLVHEILTVIKLRPKFFFYFVHISNDNKCSGGFQDICFYDLGNQNILSMTLKTLFSAMIFR